MNPPAEKYLRKGALPLIFCPGCGDGTVLNIFLRAVDEMGIFKDLALVGGIGCSGWLPTYLQSDVLHVLHGRAIPFATGLKLTDPRRKVVAIGVHRSSTRVRDDREAPLVPGETRCIEHLSWVRRQV